MEVPVPIKLPEQLLQNCDKPEIQVQVYADLVEGLISYNEALDKCNDDKEALRSIYETEIGKGTK